MSVNNVKNSIGWCDYTINPIKGLCPMDCKDNQGKPYCYARRIYKRFKLDETIRFDVVGYYAADWGIKKLKTPSKIFVGSTMELFGDWVEPRWLNVVFQVTRRYPQHTFIFLTKQPQNLIKWSPYPSNCQIGVSVTNQIQYDNALKYLKEIDATVKFLSMEPLLEHINIMSFLEQKINLKLKDAGISWVIIGQQTPISPKTTPKIEWIMEIVEVVDRVGIPIFLKDNLIPVFSGKEYIIGYYRQEFPLEVK